MKSQQNQNATTTSVVDSIFSFVQQISPYLDTAINSLSEVFLGDPYHKDTDLTGNVNENSSDIS